MYLQESCWVSPEHSIAVGSVLALPGMCSETLSPQTADCPGIKHLNHEMSLKMLLKKKKEERDTGGYRPRGSKNDKKMKSTEGYIVSDQERWREGGIKRVTENKIR